MDTSESYDKLADHYHLIFEHWESSVERQAAVLSSILEHKCGLPSSARILDCACGIGTQRSVTQPRLDHCNSGPILV